jgi:hypothetical protein
MTIGLDALETLLIRHRAKLLTTPEFADLLNRHFSGEKVFFTEDEALAAIEPSDGVK